MADTPNASGEPGELYLDAAATESVSPAVIEAMTPFLTEAYANPASVHQPGKTAARALDAARASFAAALGARPDDVIFTSGGTESDNLAIKGIAMARMRKLGLRPVCGFAEADGKQPANCRPRIIISAIEHPAVAQSAAWLHEWFGFEVVRIPVDAQAHLDLDALERELDGEASERTTMVSTMLANNEVGTVEPVEELVRIAHAHGVPIHVDAVQAAGQIPIRFRDWDVDALSVSGHKFGTPKGLGALLVRGRTPIEPVLSGGGQERGLRSGTQNVAGAVALAIGLNESNAPRTPSARSRLLHLPRRHRGSAARRPGRARHRCLIRLGLRHRAPRDSCHVAGDGPRTVHRQIGITHDFPQAADPRTSRTHQLGHRRVLHRPDPPLNLTPLTRKETT